MWNTSPQLGQGVPKDTPKNAAFAIALGYLTKLDKTLLLKVQHTLFIGHEEIKLGSTWELRPCWLSFIVLESVRQASGGRGVNNNLIWV